MAVNGLYARGLFAASSMGAEGLYARGVFGAGAGVPPGGGGYPGSTVGRRVRRWRRISVILLCLCAL